MKRRLTFRTAVWVAFAAVALMSLGANAGAVQGDKKIRLYDDCEATSFNAVIGPGTCVGNGHTTFDEFIAELVATQDVHSWRNQPSAVHLNVGHPILIENKGGEEHTFTRVANFGGGLVPDLNGISGNPVVIPECSPANIGSIVFLPAGASEDGPIAGTSQLPVGTNRFQCCIHPWMRTVIQVAEPSAQASSSNSANSESASHHGHH